MVAGLSTLSSVSEYFVRASAFAALAPLVAVSGTFGSNFGALTPLDHGRAGGTYGFASLNTNSPSALKISSPAGTSLGSKG